MERIWPTEGRRGLSVREVETTTEWEDVFDRVRALAPQDEPLCYLRSQALQLSSDLMQSRWMLIEQSQNRLPTTFLIVLISWLTALFLSLGLLAPESHHGLGPARGRRVDVRGDLPDP